MNIITIKKISDYNISATDSPKQNCCCNNELKEFKLSIEKSQQQI